MELDLVVFCEQERHSTRKQKQDRVKSGGISFIQEGRQRSISKYSQPACLPFRLHPLFSRYQHLRRCTGLELERFFGSFSSHNSRTHARSLSLYLSLGPQASIKETRYLLPSPPHEFATCKSFPLELLPSPLHGHYLYRRMSSQEVIV